MADSPRRPRSIGLSSGVTVRRAADRDRTTKPWLDSRHTFAFGTYDRVWSGLGALKVLNHDWIAPGAGFELHPHWDMEIVTWVLDGALRHRDDRGGDVVLGLDDVQRISAGTGILHSEHNASAMAPVELFQLWIQPAHKGRTPSHDHRRAPRTPTAGLRLIAAPEAGDDHVAIDQDVHLHAGTLPAGATLDHAIAPGRRVWLQLARGAVALDDLRLDAGDGAAIIDRPRVALTALDDARLLLADLA